MSGSGLISSDSHVVEPPDLWTTRIARRFRERAPRVQRESDGDWWYIDGKRSMSFLGVQTGDRFHKDATELIISVHTVRDHIRALYDKAGVNSRGELIGSGPDCLIPANPPRAALEAQRKEGGARGDAERGAARGGYRRPAREGGR